ncbi:MAG: (d)CMP kinase [Lactobacillaceae bacterium]|nr:(d)CMP kinase [Lactobacillaceae bacterium]
MIITIDGPASAGKGTLAANLAKKYKLSHFDTGMVYRAVGLEMFLNGLDVNDEAAAEKIAKSLTFAKMMELSKHPEFRGANGGNYASIVSAHPKVRTALLKMQQDFSKNPTFADGTPANGAVYDGRDTGTVVCPNADYKFFLTASSEIRAKRRYLEFVEKGIDIAYEKVLSDIVERDARDSGRSTAPLKPADDAVIVDTSDMTAEEVFDKACQIIGLK